ncbi:hypothetical protein [Palleronia caenipelagi]|uniref:DUF995 domain-containing protein n=1 Tax=Palleronia caenipelagi TaxID=2489174 RepID=A0A547Q5P9_9RHOB|nr:hypothetical protein [Palleronia caenipelagi]TRD21712.1 hypothetical protein FEV53_08200 [Palleronia caenipelagi]
MTLFRTVLTGLTFLLANIAAAETPLSGDAFDAYTRGKTLTFSADGAPYGMEEYLPGQRVRWSFLDGKCQQGVWYESADRICFEYEGNPDPQCWRFYEGSNGLRAEFADRLGADILYETRSTDEELLCYGPDVGV